MNVIADRHLWLTADGERLVEAGDPEASSLLAAPGHVVPDWAVVKFGLGDEPEEAEDEGESPRRRRGRG